MPLRTAPLRMRSKYPRRASILVGKIRSVGDQSAGIDIGALNVDRGKLIASTLTDFYEGPITGASEFGTGGYDPATSGTGDATGITEYPGPVFYLSVPD